MSEIFQAGGEIMTTKTLEQEIKELVAQNGTVRMSKVLCLVSQRLKEQDDLKLDLDNENHRVLKLSNQD